MANRRPSGDGMVRKREDGRWEGRIVIGHKANGDSIFRYIYADTQKELTAKLRKNIDIYQGIDLMEQSRMTLSEWLDQWLEQMSITLRPSTLEHYRKDLTNHVTPYLGTKLLTQVTAMDAGPDGRGAITIKDLIKSALRMRPDRIVVGEVRGAEALDMLQAMNTGHDGSLSTGHANSTYDMLSRLETMVLQGAAGLPLEAIRQQIASAVDIVIHLSRLRDKSRKTMEIVEILDYNPTERRFETNTLYEFIELPESTKEKVVGKLVRTSNPMRNKQKLENAGIYREI